MAAASITMATRNQSILHSITRPKDMDRPDRMAEATAPRPHHNNLHMDTMYVSLYL